MRATIALAQLQSHANPDENLTKALAAVELASRGGAQLIVLPEIFMALLAVHNFNATYARSVSQTLNGPYVSGLQETAQRHGLWVVSGMLETDPETSDKTYNTTVVIDARGELLAAYRKTHMYDAFGFNESAVFSTGDKLFTPLETPFGRMGLFVCYELRFPEIARWQAHKGVDFFVMPAAWVIGAMKEVHWRHLVVARAIENTAYMFACGQVGNNYLGRSLVVDPFGVVLGEGSEEEGLILAEIGTQRLEQVRSKVPSLSHRRFDLYR